MFVCRRVKVLSLDREHWRITSVGVGCSGASVTDFYTGASGYTFAHVFNNVDSTGVVSVQRNGVQIHTCAGTPGRKYYVKAYIYQQNDVMNLPTIA